MTAFGVGLLLEVLELSDGGIAGSCVRSMDWSPVRKIYLPLRHAILTARIHQPRSNSCSTIRLFSVSIESTGSPFENVLSPA